MKKCLNCGFANDAAMNFCLECGMQLAANPLSAAKTENLPAGLQSVPTFEAPKKRSRKYLWIFGGLASLLLLSLFGIVGVLFLASNFGQDNSGRTLAPLASPTKKATASPQKSANVDWANNSSETPEVKETPTGGTTLETEQTPEPETEAAPNPSFTPPAKGSAQGTFNIRADKGWQLSNLDVVPREKFLLVPTGEVNVRAIAKGITPEGVALSKYKARRLFPEFPTGALLMRTRYADGNYSKTVAVADKKASGVWQNAPDERGKIEFCINDNEPDGNDGEFVVTLGLIEE